MIRVVRTGEYSLIETKEQTKILVLDNRDTFAWVNVKEIGEILVASHKSHKADAILALGKYRMYDVKDEPELSDQMHIELHVGNGYWQGYLLPTGLPEGSKIRNRIIPTHEVLTKTGN